MRKQSGMVLMMVLMIVMVMMILTITILTQSLNQSTSTHKQIEKIKKDQLAKGAFWKAYANRGQVDKPQTTETIDGKTFQTTVTTEGNRYIVDVVSSEDPQ